MGRKTIGEKKLTNTEKQKCYRDKQNKEVQWEKDRIRKAISCENLKKDSSKYKNYLKQQATNHRILRNKKKKKTMIKALHLIIIPLVLLLSRCLFHPFQGVSAKPRKVYLKNLPRDEKLQKPYLKTRST